MWIDDLMLQESIKAIRKFDKLSVQSRDDLFKLQNQEQLQFGAYPLRDEIFGERVSCDEHKVEVQVEGMIHLHLYFFNLMNRRISGVIRCFFARLILGSPFCLVLRL